jgi:Rieske Fe-S protein
MGVEQRRAFLAKMLGGLGLLLSYGVFGTYAIAYLFPARVRRRAQRLFIGRRADLADPAGRTFVDQKGRTLLIRAEGAWVLAFDTRCPHLGCKVHWEPQSDRFFCPCHNGVFDRQGVAISGPPADAGQSLAQVALEVDAGDNVFLTIEA